MFATATFACAATLEHREVALVNERSKDILDEASEAKGTKENGNYDAEKLVLLQ